MRLEAGSKWHMHREGTAANVSDDRSKDKPDTLHPEGLYASGILIEANREMARS
jgi:hypothetical protein